VTGQLNSSLDAMSVGYTYQEIKYSAHIWTPKYRFFNLKWDSTPGIQ